MRGKIPTYQTGINTCSTDKRFLKEWVTLVCIIHTLMFQFKFGKIVFKFDIDGKQRRCNEFKTSDVKFFVGDPNGPKDLRKSTITFL